KQVNIAKAMEWRARDDVFVPVVMERDVTIHIVAVAAAEEACFLVVVEIVVRERDVASALLDIDEAVELSVSSTRAIVLGITEQVVVVNPYMFDVSVRSVAFDGNCVRITAPGKQAYRHVADDDVLGAVDLDPEVRRRTWC